MNTTLAQRPNVLKKDADGQWYSIPAGEVDGFVQAVESVMLAEFMSNDWNVANDDLSDRYGAYMLGDL